MPKDVGLGILGTILDTIFPGLGAVGAGFLDAILPDPHITTYKEIKQLYNYYSAAFDETFWDKFFDQYLGTPDSDTGLINQYFQKYGKIPDSIHIKNFDFYTPFSVININSTHTWEKGYNIAGEEEIPFSENFSTSNFDLSKLALNLGVDFKLKNNIEPGYKELLTKLQNKYNESNPISLDQSQFVQSKQGGYYIDNNVQKDPAGVHNEGNILNYLNAQEGYTELIPNLTLKGELIPGKASQVEVHFNDGKYKDTVPIYVDIS